MNMTSPVEKKSVITAFFGLFQKNPEDIHVDLQEARQELEKLKARDELLSQLAGNASYHQAFPDLSPCSSFGGSTIGMARVESDPDHIYFTVATAVYAKLFNPTTGKTLCRTRYLEGKYLKAKVADFERIKAIFAFYQDPNLELIHTLVVMYEHLQIMETTPKFDSSAINNLAKGFRNQALQTYLATKH